MPGRPGPVFGVCPVHIIDNRGSGLETWAGFAGQFASPLGLVLWPACVQRVCSFAPEVNAAGTQPNAQDQTLTTPTRLFRRATIILLTLALFLPVATTVLGGLGLLLSELGDAQGASWVRVACVSLGTVWLLDLVALVMAAASLHLLHDASRGPDQPGSQNEP